MPELTNRTLTEWMDTIVALPNCGQSKLIGHYQGYRAQSDYGYSPVGQFNRPIDLVCLILMDWPSTTLFSIIRGLT